MENNGIITNAEMRGLLESAAIKQAPISAPLIMEVFDRLAADAQRFNGMCMALCEQDDTLLEKMSAAVESTLESIGGSIGKDVIVTPEMVNAIADAALLAACEARK